MIRISSGSFSLNFLPLATSKKQASTCFSCCVVSFGVYVFVYVPILANFGRCFPNGFPGTVNTNKFTLNEEYDGSNPTREATFAGYALLSLYYTEAESTERYSQFPLIIEKFAFVRKYMKENYGIDLEAIAKGPNDWDIQPHPETPGNNDEDGGDDDDPWPGFDW